jgi:hypothetical protein
MEAQKYTAPEKYVSPELEVLALELSHGIFANGESGQDGEQWPIDP